MGIGTHMAARNNVNLAGPDLTALIKRIVSEPYVDGPYVDGPLCQRPIAAPPALPGNVGSCIAAWRTSKRPTHGHRQIRSCRSVGMDDDLSGQGAQADPSAPLRSNGRAWGTALGTPSGAGTSGSWHAPIAASNFRH